MPSRELSPRAVRTITVLLFVATFAAGTLAGAGFLRWTTHHSPPEPPGPLPFWELDLTTEQQEKTKQIFEKYRPELDIILQDAFPKVRAINDKIEGEVREILTEPQKQKLDKLKANRPRHGPNGRPPLPPPPPPSR